MKRLLLVAALALGACTSPEPYDYAAFRDHMPVSILVLPPLDSTMEVEATYAYLSTVTRPLAERGYYVFPVGVVDRMMKENGLPGPGEMHTVSLSKLQEIFDPDAVLYLELTDWGTAYRVLDSSTEVTVAGRLIHMDSGMQIWEGEETAVQSSSAGANSLTDMLVGAVVNQVFTSFSDPSEDVARQANQGLFHSGHDGLLVGPYHPEFGEEE